MEEIIKKAIEGGYKKERYYFDENGNWDWEPAEVMFIFLLVLYLLMDLCHIDFVFLCILLVLLYHLSV